MCIRDRNYSAPGAGAAEKATQRIGTEVSRHFEKGAEKKNLDAAQLKTHTLSLIHIYVRREKALAIQGFSDTKTAKAYCNTKTAENGFLIFHADQERK